jgi:N-carbamoyl-L-amino-acid hydrolase
MSMPSIRAERLQSRLEALATIGRDPAGGLSRFPYSAAHAEAVRVVATWMAEAGLHAGCDAIGNLIGHRRGTGDGAAIVLGSHLDSVPHGGTFDGALGVLGGLEVAQTLREADVALRHDLVVVGFADEEGYQYGTGTLASRCALGEVPRARFHMLRGRDGRTLAEATAAFSPGPPRTVLPARAAAYLELHIEQGPVLARGGRRVAAVEAITGIARSTLVLDGEANHAGTTPMALRRDALVGAAEVVLAVKTLADAAAARAVGTVGMISVSPGATNVVPGRTELTIELRSPDGPRLRDLCGRTADAIDELARRYGLAARRSDWDVREPVLMDTAIIEALRAAISEAGQEPMTLPSWAGHDAAIMAPHVPTGMLFVPSIDGVSHSPNEWTAWEDVALGADVLLRAVGRLDTQAALPVRTLPVEVA